MHLKDESGNKIETPDPNPIYILCHPYSNNPDDNFQRCVDIVRYLRMEYNLKVFSPILHTHQYELTLKSQQNEYGEDYYQWDLDLYDSFPSDTIMVFPQNYQISKGCMMEMEWAIKNKNTISYIIY